MDLSEWELRKSDCAECLAFSSTQRILPRICCSPTVQGENKNKKNTNTNRTAEVSVPLSLDRACERHSQRSNSDSVQCSIIRKMYAEKNSVGEEYECVCNNNHELILSQRFNKRQTLRFIPTTRGMVCGGCYSNFLDGTGWNVNQKGQALRNSFRVQIDIYHFLSSTSFHFFIFFLLHIFLPSWWDEKIPLYIHLNSVRANTVALDIFNFKELFWLMRGYLSIEATCRNSTNVQYIIILLCAVHTFNQNIDFRHNLCEKLRTQPN